MPHCYLYWFCITNSVFFLPWFLFSRHIYVVSAVTGWDCLLWLWQDRNGAIMSVVFWWRWELSSFYAGMYARPQPCCLPKRTGNFWSLEACRSFITFLTMPRPNFPVCCIPAIRRCRSSWALPCAWRICFFYWYISGSMSWRIRRSSTTKWSGCS